MDADEASAASRNRFGVRGLVRAFGRRLVAVECRKASNFPGPLDAALLWRQVAKAAKAVTSHRTPNSCRLRAEFRHCSTDEHGLRRTPTVFRSINPGLQRSRNLGWRLLLCPPR